MSRKETPGALASVRLLEGLGHTRGIPFLRAMVRAIALRFEVDHCFVAEFLERPPTRCTSLAFWSDGDWRDAFDYDLAGTPCEGVLGGKSYVFSSGVQQRFPDNDKLTALEADSLAGVPLTSADGQVIGAITLVGRGPMKPDAILVPLLEGLALTAAVEVEHLRDKAELRETEQRFRALAEASFEGIIISRDGIAIDVNDQVARMLGFTREEMIGQPVGRRVSHEQRKMVSRPVHDNRAVEPFVFTVYHRDRSERLLEARGRPILYDGRPAVVTAVRDVTERHRREERTLHEQRMEAMGRLAGGIAHDFNNLLTVILGGAQLLTRPNLPSERVTATAESVVDAARRAAGMTRQLLAFGRRQPPSHELLPFNESVRESESMLRRLLPESIALEFALADESEWVRFDRTQLSQVVINLAVNARDAMPHGGTLRIATGHERIGDEGVVRAGDYVVLTVRDDGAGMDAEVRRRIFEPFFSTKSDKQSVGLGLSTVYGLVRQAGGTIVVSSEPGHGSEFRVYLPAVPAAEATTEVTRPADTSLRGSGRILVVEDVDEVASFIAEGLRDVGFEVQTYQDPRIALAALDEPAADPTAMITDLVMPGMHGQELARRVRERRPGLPVLFVSGYAPDSEEARPFLGKPFTLIELHEAIGKLLHPCV